MANDREGKKDADDQVDDVSDERYDEGGAVRVVRDIFCDTVSRLYTF